jgi:site-specific DNA recombinase
MSLDYFNKYVPKEQKLTLAQIVWLYTRVSTKDQFDTNHSIENQIEQAQKYAAQNGYTIAQEFGGTYESAKGDFTRTEFKKLITDVRKAKRKPLAIMIFKMSRFSRSGGGAIGLVNELLHELGVHLIEVSTGKNTFTPRGEMEIIESLLHARKENIERAEITRPGLERFIREGNRLGKAPRGYNHRGPRVNDPNRHSPIQELVINDEGKLLKRAWQWKLEEQPDYLIRQKLEDLGLKMSKQGLSEMWRKPFYCGVNVNRFCDKPVLGNWKPLIHPKDFEAINKILDGGKSGYVQTKLVSERPLQSNMLCDDCRGKMTGYKKNKSNTEYHYYKCQTKGCCSDMNANTSKKSVGLNDKFVELLERISLPDNARELFREQMELTVNALNQDKINTEEVLLERIATAKTQRENLENKFYIESGMPEATFERLSTKLNSEIEAMEEQLPNSGAELSNSESLIESCCQFSQNLSKHWRSGGLEIKTRLLKLLFPDGLVLIPSKRTYRTNSMNTLFVCIADIVRDSGTKKKDSTGINPIESSLVAGAGLEPTTFGL